MSPTPILYKIKIYTHMHNCTHDDVNNLRCGIGRIIDLYVPPEFVYLCMFFVPPEFVYPCVFLAMLRYHTLRYGYSHQSRLSWSMPNHGVLGPSHTSLIPQ